MGNASAFHVIIATVILTGPACVPVSHIVEKDHTQTIVLHSEPPGATIYRRVGADAVELGRAPVVLRGDYSVVERHTDKASCVLAGASQGMEMANPMEDEVDLVFGLVGMVVGAAVGGATCHEGDGVLETRSEPLTLVATKPGYLAERYTLTFPHNQPQLTIRLIPDPNAQDAADLVAAAEVPVAPELATATPEPAPVAAQNAQVPEPSTDRRPAHAPSAGPMGLPIRRPGLTIYPVQAAVRYGEPDPGLADGLTLLLVAELDRVGFTGASPAAGAELVLQSRLLEVGDLCILSANLHRVDDPTALRVASARGPCSPAALQQAVERLAAQLAPEDGTELAAQ